MKLILFISILIIIGNVRIHKSLSEFNKTLQFDKPISDTNCTNTPLNINCDAIIEGWLKYLEINQSGEIPSYFEKNKMANIQNSENKSINTLMKDPIGYVNIPNEDYFFFKLCKEDLVIFTARNERYKQFKASMKISSLVPQITTMPFKGGVEEVGNFQLEGYCFMLKFVNSGVSKIWELCADTALDKDRWMNTIVKQTYVNGDNKQQPGTIIHHIVAEVVGPTIQPAPVILAGPVIPVPFPQIPLSPLAPPSPTAMVAGPSGLVGVPLMPPPMPGVVGVPSGMAIVSKPIEYLPIGDWSQCSKPCGKGTQTRPVKCADEHICQGTHYEERECNTQACKEDIDKSLENLQKVSEGQWELLGSWSPCSRDCGGGIRSIDRRCISNNCTGNALLVQDCNTFICAGDPNKLVTTASSLFNREGFDECKLLEGNLLMIVNNQKLLSHVEVNRQTIQIFSQNNPGVPITIPLAKLLDIHSGSNCFEMTDQFGIKTMLCPKEGKNMNNE
jgi:hypothetical protein